MTGVKCCSREDCPPENTKIECTTNCGKCERIVHLKCIGIEFETKQVLFHPNMRIYCQQCATKTTTTNTSATDNATSNATSNNNKTSPNGKRQMANRLDEMLTILNNVQSIVGCTEVSVNLNRAETKSIAATLVEINNAANKN